jgi:hypothetical protein
MNTLWRCVKPMLIFAGFGALCAFALVGLYDHRWPGADV